MSQVSSINTSLLLRSLLCPSCLRLPKCVGKIGSLLYVCIFAQTCMDTQLALREPGLVVSEGPGVGRRHLLSQLSRRT